jgi:hypothetical protein
MKSLLHRKKKNAPLFTTPTDIISLTLISLSISHSRSLARSLALHVRASERSALSSRSLLHGRRDDARLLKSALFSLHLYICMCACVFACVLHTCTCMCIFTPAHTTHTHTAGKEGRKALAKVCALEQNTVSSFSSFSSRSSSCSPCSSSSSHR